MFFATVMPGMESAPEEIAVAPFNFPDAPDENGAYITKYEMENAVRLSVPLTVDAHIGQSWAEAH